MMTPLPAARPSALITTGRSNSSSASRASSGLFTAANRAVGIPARNINSLANALLDSKRAAAAVGPTIRRPLARNLLDDAGGQRNFRPDYGEVGIDRLGGRKIVRCRETGGRHLCDSWIPRSSVERGCLRTLRQFFQQSACSRPPEPTTRIFIWINGKLSMPH